MNLKKLIPINILKQELIYHRKILKKKKKIKHWKESEVPKI